MVLTIISIKFYELFLCFLLFLVTSYIALSLLLDDRFDVALLVPLLAPVLSLQHIIFPLRMPYKGLSCTPFK